MAKASDKLLADFTPSTRLGGRQSNADSDEEPDMAGGFCQPRDLSAFVNASIRSSVIEDTGTGDSDSTSDSSRGVKRSVDDFDNQRHVCADFSRKNSSVSEEWHGSSGSGFTCTSTEGQRSNAKRYKKK